MTPERMQQIQDLYVPASECDERDRPSFLQRACAGDEALRQEVESLLNQEQRIGGFLEQTALRDAARGMMRRDESLVGQRFGHYELLALIGRGGMGEVYKAKDTRLERTVAIKILPQDSLSSPQAKQRFRLEAQTIANLKHPNICVLYDVGETDGIDFLVMEYLEGVTLAERLKKRALPLAECVNIAMQIGDALEKAHRSGVVHRDLKPANIMLTPEGAKLLDFGVARLIREIAGAVEPTPLTGANVIVGTLQYMSPEQIDGVKADPRSDIFAFGTVLYEMMTGQKAFEGDSNATLISSIATKTPPPPSKVIPAFPALVDHVISRCLAKDPAQRWHSARDVSLELKWAVEAAHESPALTRRAGWRTWAIGLAVLIAAVIGIGSLYDRAAMTAPEMRVEITTPPTTESQSFAISPDGRKIAFVADTEAGPALWLRPLNSSVARPLRGTEGATYPFWSPGSDSIGFFASNKLKRVNIDDGTRLTLADAPAGRGGTWSHAGLILFSPNLGTPLFRVSPTGGAATAVTRLDVAEHVTHRFPHFLPDGRRFLFLAIGPTDVRGIYIGSVDSAKTKRIMAAETAADFVPPATLLFVRNGTLLAQTLDLDREELTGDPITVADTMAFDNGARAAAFSVSTSGVLAYRAGGASKRQLTWFDRSGKVLGTLGPPDQNYLLTPRVSPDGRRAVAFREIQENRDVWIFEAGRLIRFTFDLARDQYPIWSPDGKTIVFDSDRNGHRNLYRKGADKAGTEELLLETDGDKGVNDISPDGRYLIYVTPTNPDTGADLWVQPLFGNERKPWAFLQTKFNERQAQFSPDGEWIAYQSNESGTQEIYIRPFPKSGGQWQVSTSGGIQPRWRRDGKEVFYVSPEGKLMAAPVDTKGGVPQIGPSVALFQTRIWGGGTNSTNNQQYDVAPDNRFLMNVTTEDAIGQPITLLLNWRSPK